MVSDPNNSLSTDILWVLGKYFLEKNPGEKTMMFGEFRMELDSRRGPQNYSSSDLMLEIRQRQNWIIDDLTNDMAGTLRLTPEGLRVARDILKRPPAAPNSQSDMALPADFDELLADAPTLREQVREFEPWRQVLKNLRALSSQHHIFSLLSDRFSIDSGIPVEPYLIDNVKFLPIQVDVTLCETEELESFLVSLLEVLTERLGLYERVPIKYPPRRIVGEASKAEFYEYWQKLLTDVSGIHPVIVFDLKEILSLSESPKNGAKIYEFLCEFIGNESNGSFVLVGTEALMRLKRKRLSKLIEMCSVIFIQPYSSEVIEQIFSLLQNYVTIESSALQHCRSLCDSQPLVVQHLINVMLDIARPCLHITESDVEAIKSALLNRVESPLKQIYQDISLEEQTLLWLMSRRPFKPWLPSTLAGINGLAARWGVSEPEDWETGVVNLASRGWILRTGNRGTDFELQLGILHHWLRTSTNSRSEVIVQ